MQFHLLPANPWLVICCFLSTGCAKYSPRRVASTADDGERNELQKRLLFHFSRQSSSHPMLSLHGSSDAWEDSPLQLLNIFTLRLSSTHHQHHHNNCPDVMEKKCPCATLKVFSCLSLSVCTSSSSEGNTFSSHSLIPGHHQSGYYLPSATVVSQSMSTTRKPWKLKSSVSLCEPTYSNDWSPLRINNSRHRQSQQRTREEATNILPSIIHCGWVDGWQTKAQYVLHILGIRHEKYEIEFLLSAYKSHSEWRDRLTMVLSRANVPSQLN